jgi:bisphosphoglycerate-independent phosphoglycerate mutase (AlkP superfamily)
MSEEAGQALAEVLRDLSQYVRSAPVLAATPDGGVHASWEHQGFCVEIVIEGAMRTVYQADETSGREWEGELSRADALEKWVWTASATF